MSTIRSLFAQLIICVVVTSIILVRVSQIPESVAVHFGLDGKPDRFGSPREFLFVLPFIFLAPILTVAIPKLPQGKFRFGDQLNVFNVMMIIVCAMMAGVQLLVISAVEKPRFEGTPYITAIVFIGFALIGNFLGKTRPNRYMGIRTPWTYASEEVWNETHQRAGKLWFYGGFLGAGLCFLGLPIWFSVAMLVCMGMVPIFDSYLVYCRWKARN